MTRMNSSGGQQPNNATTTEKVWFNIKFRTVCEFCVLMPLGGLVVCLITALIFQFEHIQETACQVSHNLLKSVFLRKELENEGCTKLSENLPMSKRKKKALQNISQSQYIHLFILVITYKD